MRREDREIPRCREIESIFHNALICRIGLAECDEPSIVPVCSGDEIKAIYLHSTPPAGKKISMLKKIRDAALKLTKLMIEYVESVRVHGGDEIPECHWFWRGLFL